MWFLQLYTINYFLPVIVRNIYSAHKVNIPKTLSIPIFWNLGFCFCISVFCYHCSSFLTPVISSSTVNILVTRETWHQDPLYSTTGGWVESNFQEYSFGQEPWALTISKITNTDMGPQKVQFWYHFQSVAKVNELM